MGGAHGVSEIRKVTFFGLSFGLAMADATRAETGVGKAGAFLQVLDEAADLLTLDRVALKAQWEEMDDLDWEELVADVKEEFEFPNGQLEQKVEKSFEAGLKLLQQVDDLLEIWLPA